MNHSPEPWTFGEGHEYAQIILDASKKEVLNIRRPVGVMDGKTFMENIERIVACVNFLKEFPTSWLEAHHAVSLANKEQFKTLGDIGGFAGLMAVVRNQESVRNPDTSDKRKEKP